MTPLEVETEQRELRETVGVLLELAGMMRRIGAPGAEARMRFAASRLEVLAASSMLPTIYDEVPELDPAVARTA